MRTVAFFNNKGGVGKTSLVYHLAWMYADLGLNVVAADLDPQANLTSMFLDETRLEELWAEDGERQTVFGALQPLLGGTGDVAPPHVEEISRPGHETALMAGTDDVAPPHVEEAAPGLGLVVGDLNLSKAEDELSSRWPKCLDGEERAFRVLSALWRVLRLAADSIGARVVLVDVGPNLGALNRAALVTADKVAIPLAPDLYSLQGLRNLGPTLRRWRSGWLERRNRNPVSGLDLPEGAMEPVGYIVMQHAVRLGRPVMAYGRWMDRIPGVYREVVGSRTDRVREGLSVDNDPDRLAVPKHFRSLMPLAQEARKPMFLLKPADGAFGGHTQAVRDCYRDFRSLAGEIARRAGIDMP